MKIHSYGAKEKKILPNTDIYIVDAYGKTKTFYNYCKIVFLGGSLIKHGGQNPLEAARFGCNILHGPNVSNFNEIYKFLRTNNVSKKVTNFQSMLFSLKKLFSKRDNASKIKKKLTKVGKKILENTYQEINILLKNEI